MKQPHQIHNIHHSISINIRSQKRIPLQYSSSRYMVQAHHQINYIHNFVSIQITHFDSRVIQISDLDRNPILHCPDRAVSTDSRNNRQDITVPLVKSASHAVSI